jgi:hypothetical protein
MPLPVIAGVARCTLAGSIQGGGRWANTWHARRVDLGGVDTGEAASLTAVMTAFYAALVIPSVCGGTTIDSVDVTPLDGTSGAFHFGPGLVGSSGGSAAPPEVAEVITIRTAFRGRRARGRVFLPALTAGAFDTVGHIGAGYLTAVSVEGALMMGAANVAGWEIGVASYGKSRRWNRTTTPATFVETTWDPFFTPATSLTMDNRADVVRARKQ